jgi:hypothetical protein
MPQCAIASRINRLTATRDSLSVAAANRGQDPIGFPKKSVMLRGIGRSAQRRIDFTQRFFVPVWHDDCPQGEN